MFDYEKILEIAEARYRRWSRGGLRNQTVCVQDGLDYWVAQVAYEFGLDDKESFTGAANSDIIS